MFPNLLIVCAITLCSRFLWSDAIVIKAGPTSYARFPPWNGCLNASFSFEFKTTQTGNAFLWYVDDMGEGTDYFYVGVYLLLLTSLFLQVTPLHFKGNAGERVSPFYGERGE